MKLHLKHNANKLRTCFISYFEFFLVSFPLVSMNFSTFFCLSIYTRCTRLKYRSP